MNKDEIKYKRIFKMNDKLYKWFCILSDEIMNIFDYLLEKIEEDIDE